jgi:hypothetical protein
MFMLEMVVAVALLLAAMTLAVQLIGWVGRRPPRGGAQDAGDPGGGQPHGAADRPGPADLTPGRVAALRLSPRARRALPGGELAVRVTAAEVGLTRIRVEVRWRDRAGVPQAPVRLTSWIASRRGARP